MKQKRLLGLAVAVAALFAVYFGLTALTARQETAAQTEKTLRALKGTVNEIAASYGDGWKLVRAADESWQWAEDADFPITQTYPDGMAEAASGMTVSSKVLDDLSTADPADYGLDEPQNVVTLKTDAGEEMTLTFGGENTHTGERYLTVSGDPSLYTASASAAQVFSYGLYDMIQFETWPVSVATQIDSVRIERKGAPELRLDVARNEAGEASYTVTENGTASAASGTEAMGLLQDIAGLAVNGCIDYKAQEAALQEYGLQEPDATITVTWTDVEEQQQSVTLYVGAGEEAATYFTRTEGSMAVNIMDGSAVASILNATGTNLKAEQAQA